MSLVCSKCAHANPPEAYYCYFDGAALAGRAGEGRPIQPGSHPFPSPFVFPSGQRCGNFDQLAMACQQNWAAAVDLLRQGFLASFFAGIGRADLATAAKEAARFPDVYRGLDRLLAKIPSQVLEAPKLRAEPTDMNLGVIQIGTNKSFELHLANLGMRLLYGSVSSSSKWLTLGDAPGNPQKLFQFGGDVVVKVQIRGKYLRAGAKALEGNLLVESNGGTLAVTVRADVPAKPYSGGVLAGATTPRQVAEKALAAPKEAAPLFETGAVAKWFVANGWIYPVRGPSATGVGAVQQFFEALGLSKPPKVEISQTTLTLRGEVGKSIQSTLELRTQEKRPVYGHAICDQPWLDVGSTVLNGRNTIIQVVVPRVPNRPGETLQANVTITSNGNQKFKVTVDLEITSNSYRLADAPPGPIPVVQAISVPSGEVVDAVLAEPDLPYAVAVTPPPPRSGRRSQVQAISAKPVAVAVAVAERPPPLPELAAARLPIPRAVHIVPAVLLALMLLIILVRDIFAPASAESTDAVVTIDPNPRVAVYFDRDTNDLGKVGSLMRFGLVALPKDQNQPEKKLTYDKYGRTNSTVVKIGEQTDVFGFARSPSSKWEIQAQSIKSPWLKKNETESAFAGLKSVWHYQGGANSGTKVKVTQTVEIVPGEPIELKNGELKRYLDTCQVRYTIENVGHDTNVGLRMLVDTLIGIDASNDGVPFTVPGLPGLVDTSANFEAPNKIPDFLQVLEVPDLKHPGIVGFMNLKLGVGVEPPSRVLLTHWPERIDLWDVPERPFLSGPNKVPDSAVVLYWGERPLAKGAKRELGFSYGLGSLSVKDGQLGISVGGSLIPNVDWTVDALVQNPQQGQTLTLKLPDGLRLADGETLEQPVKAPDTGGKQSHAYWHVRADREGTFVIEVHSSTSVSQKKRVTIKTRTIF